MGSEHYCLRWNNHQSNLLGVFSQLLQDESLVDVTLACAEGHSIRAHKVVLSACSSYFQTLFIDHPNRHPIVILKDVCFEELKTIVDFMYKGEVNVEYCQLSALLKTAESLKVKGLTEMTNLSSTSSTEIIKKEKTEKDSDETETFSSKKNSEEGEITAVTETVNKRLTNENTKSPSSCLPANKKLLVEQECEEIAETEANKTDSASDSCAKGGCPGPTEMSASGMALCQMPSSCSSPHVSEPFPGTSCLPPVQQVPLRKGGY
ncbi:B-cell CLL/lymphoma 6 member B protein, putative [Pediculus humanus corporis]|uniref:B-cell CLL/lymphoma 6 member B protein, putative n=1 Tax=Pediculus humanus subsp. corporis TaxID=121224 RepID=E0VKU0_PEDHC|nr:B-cell CLL/lymphoma 6 member B protein, putative [Pediculus humanus corporis]EEB13996.1 B-cell CLL/lymphoma 6 member B protein, putative [Pediculus humanus corporis]